MIDPVEQRKEREEYNFNQPSFWVRPMPYYHQSSQDDDDDENADDDDVLFDLRAL